MPKNFLSVLSIALVLGVSLTLAGCGRKGDLDVPGSDRPAPKPVPGKKPKVEERHFFLDPLL
jgi:predicted small lipoprotein YifL